MSARAIVATAGLAFGSLLTVGGAATASTGALTNPVTPTFAAGTTEWDDWVYFAAHDDVVGTELWRSRGNTIELVADIDPGVAGGMPASSYPFFFAPFGDWLYFRAGSQETGVELWRTDGATAELVADINPGPEDSWPSELFVFDGRLYFSAYTPTTTFALWRFDGTTIEQVPGTDSWVPEDLIELDGWLYISARGTGGDGMYRTDGTTTERVSNLIASYPEVLDGWIYFGADSSDVGRELWRTNGSTTELVADINPSRSSDPYDLTALDGWVYFAATQSGSDNELWRSNGSTTELVADIATGPAWSRPADLEAFDGWVYFRAETQAAGAELWRTDGSHTEQVADINPGPRSSDPDYLEAAGDRLYFGAVYSFLWWTDGTDVERVAAPGTHLYSENLGVGDPDLSAWTSMTFSPETTGRHTFVLEWAWGDDVEIEVRESSTGRWIGADVGTDAPKLLTVDLAAGVDYRVAVWIRTGTTIFTTSVIEPEVGPPAGEVVFSGTVDASGVAAPRWVSSTLVPESTGDLTLLLDWDGGADVRFDVRDVATGRWLGAATVGPAPRSATVEVVAGEPIRLAVWAASGTAGFELATDGAPPPEPETVFAGTVDAGRVTAPKWVSTTFTAESTGPHTFSFGDGSDPDLRMEVRESASGTWLAAGHPTVDVDLSAGTEYRLAVWVVDGRADFEVTLEPPAG